MTGGGRRQAGRSSHGRGRGGRYGGRPSRRRRPRLQGLRKTFERFVAAHGRHGPKSKRTLNLRDRIVEEFLEIGPPDAEGGRESFEPAQGGHRAAPGARARRPTAVRDGSEDAAAALHQELPGVRARGRLARTRSSPRMPTGRRRSSSAARTSSGTRRSSPRSWSADRLPIAELKDINRCKSLGEAKASRAKKLRWWRANLRLVISIREEVHEPRASVPRPHPGGEHRLDEGGGQVSSTGGGYKFSTYATWWIPPGDYPVRIAESGPGPSGYPVHMIETINKLNRGVAPDPPGAGPRADAGGACRAHGDARGQGPPGAQDREGADLDGNTHRRRRGLASRRLSSRT